MPDAKRSYSCQNCDFTTENEADLNPVKDLEQRVAPGERVPDGECPECGSCVHEDEPEAAPTARMLTSDELNACCGGCRTNSAIETWMTRAIAKFCEVNGIALRGFDGPG